MRSLNCSCGGNFADIWQPSPPASASCSLKLNSKVKISNYFFFVWWDSSSWSWQEKKPKYCFSYLYLYLFWAHILFNPNNVIIFIYTHSIHYVLYMTWRLPSFLEAWHPVTRHGQGSGLVNLRFEFKMVIYDELGDRGQRTGSLWGAAVKNSVSLLNFRCFWGDRVKQQENESLWLS